MKISLHSASGQPFVGLAGIGVAVVGVAAFGIYLGRGQHPTNSDSVPVATQAVFSGTAQGASPVAETEVGGQSIGVDVLSGPPPNDSWSADNGAGPQSGRVVYAIPGDGASYLVVRDLNAEAKTVTSYRIRGFSRVFDPVFSPKGDTVLFKAYTAHQQDNTARLMLLNLTTRALIAGPAGVESSASASWSPDSSSIAALLPDDAGTGHWTPKSQLVIFDVADGKTKEVARGTFVSRPTWSAPHSLIYALNDTNSTSAPHPAAASEGGGAKTNSAGHIDWPNLYAVEAGDGEPNLFAHEGAAPETSPDGQWVLFVGSLGAGTASSKSQYSGMPCICLYNRKTQQRYALRPGSTLQARWTPDSRQIFLLDPVSQAGKTVTRLIAFDVAGLADGKMGAGAKLGVQTGDPAVDAAMSAMLRNSAGFHLISDVQITDSPSDGGARLLQLSHDGHALYVGIENVTRLNNRGAIDTADTLRSIDLGNAAVATVARLQHANGFDWQ